MIKYEQFILIQDEKASSSICQVLNLGTKGPRCLFNVSKQTWVSVPDEGKKKELKEDITGS